MHHQKRSGWFYASVGCAVLVLAGAIAIGGVVFMTLRWTRNFKHEMEDPQQRTARATETLNTETLPDGYHVKMNVRAPFGFGTLVMLADGEPGDDPGDIGEREHFFMYFEGPGWDSDWKEFARGGDPPFDDLGELNIHIDRSELVAQGDLTVGDMEVFYSTSLGAGSAEGFQRERGVFSVILVRCPQGDKRSRVVVWSGPPPPESAADRVRGTTGDPARIAEMLGHFRLCG